MARPIQAAAGRGTIPSRVNAWFAIEADQGPVPALFAAGLALVRALLFQSHCVEPTESVDASSSEIEIQVVVAAGTLTGVIDAENL